MPPAITVIHYSKHPWGCQLNFFIREDFVEGLNDEHIFPVEFHMFHSKNEIRVMISFFEQGKGLCAALKIFVSCIPQTAHLFS